MRTFTDSPPTTCPLQPRDKLQLLGPTELSDVDLVTLLLGSGIRGLPAPRIAQHLLPDGATVSALAGRSVESLCRFRGVGLAGACRLVAAAEFGRRVLRHVAPRGTLIDAPEIVFELWRSRIKHLREERVWVLGLDVRQRLVGERCVSIGSLDASVVHPREIYRTAIDLGAAGIILIHNHPSGDSRPSTEDRMVTTRVEEAGRWLGIDLLDHIIVAAEEFSSYRQGGW